MVDITTIIVAVISIIGGTGGFYALFKVPQEKHKIIVEAAQGAVIVQTGVITNLNKELQRIEKELDEEKEKNLILSIEIRTYKDVVRELENRLEELEQKYQDLLGRTCNLENK